MSIAKFKPSLEARRQIVIAELLDKGVTDIHGTSVNDADYDSLKQELAVLSYRQINIDSPENKFF